VWHFLTSKDCSLCRIIADYCRPQKRPMIWIWLQFLWEFRHFEPHIDFWSQELYTSGLLSFPRLVCLFIFCYKTRKSWLRSRFGLEVNTVGVYPLGPCCAKVRFFPTWFSRPTFMPIFLTIVQFSRHLFSASFPFNLFPVFLFTFFAINISQCLSIPLSHIFLFSNSFTFFFSSQFSGQFLGSIHIFMPILSINFAIHFCARFLNPIFSSPNFFDHFQILWHLFGSISNFNASFLDQFQNLMPIFSDQFKFMSIFLIIFKYFVQLFCSISNFTTVFCSDFKFVAHFFEHFPFFLFVQSIFFCCFKFCSIFWLLLAFSCDWLSISLPTSHANWVEPESRPGKSREKCDFSKSNCPYGLWLTASGARRLRG